MNAPPGTPPRDVMTGAGGFARVAGAFDRGVSGLSRLALWAAVACLTALLIIVLMQVVISLLSARFPQLSQMMSASWEDAGYLMGAGFVLAMPATLRAGGHIRVTLLRDHLSARGANIADTLASLIAVLMLAHLSYAMLARALTSFQRGSVSTASETPLWLPEAAFAIAMILFALQALARVLSLIAGQEAETPRDLVSTNME